MTAGDPPDGLPQEDEGGGQRRAAAFRAQGPVLARVCMALLGDAVAAERALEDVAAEAANSQFADDDARVLARLMGMARRACASLQSKTSNGFRTRTSGVRADRPVETAPERRPEPMIGRAMLETLKPTEREAVVLHILGGLAVADVADACGVDVATARTRIARALTQLVEQEKQR